MDATFFDSAADVSNGDAALQDRYDIDAHFGECCSPDGGFKKTPCGTIKCAPDAVCCLNTDNQGNMANSCVREPDIKGYCVPF